MPLRPLSMVLALLLTAAIPAPAVAQKTLSADEKELGAYKLTMPTVRKMAAVMRALNEEAARDPKAIELNKVREEIETLEKKDELSDAEAEKLEKLRERAEALDEEISQSSGGGDAQTISDMEARIKSQPAAMKALAREGIAPREFAKTFLALFQAALVKGFSQGKVDMAKLPPGINPENITFVEENEKELAALQIEMSGKKK